MITIISTGINAATKDLCVRSVAAQQQVEVEHLYIESEPHVTRLENWRSAIAPLPPERIVALVDGDDWLADRMSLAIVEAQHRDLGAWVTYGSYMTSDGNGGIAAQASWPPRKAPWTATHLKTFRAALFQRLTDADLMYGGRYIEHAPDMAVMLPMLEMAGPDRCRYLSTILYIYHLRGSWESTHPDRREEREAETIIRNKPERERCASL